MDAPQDSQRSPGTPGEPASQRAERARGSEGVVLPVLVAGAGIALSLVAWRLLSSYEEDSLRSTLASTSSELSRVVETRIQREISELKDLGQTWSEFGTSDLKRWEAEARFFIKRSNEFLAIEWDTANPRSDGPLTAATPEGIEVLDALKEQVDVERDRRIARESGAEALIGPFATTPGPVFELLLPVQQGKGASMTLTACLQPKILLENVLSHRAPECALTVRAADGGLLYEQGEISSEAGPQHFAEETVRVQTNEDWKLWVRPSPAMLGSLHMRLPRIVLGAGVILSILIATMIRMGLVSLTGTHKLLETSTELEGRDREIERLDKQGQELVERNTVLRQERRVLTEEIVSLKAEMAARLQDRQDSAVAELEAFTYSVSHDLRSPMGAILNYSAVLAEDYREQLGDTGCDHLSRISNSARMAIAMMDRLLVFSRIGRQEVRFSRVDVGSLMRELHEELCQGIQRQPPELSIGEMPSVQGDPTLLRVLFTNLLSNAFKFTRKVPSPRIEVGGYAQGTDTVYYVEDNGVGFDMHHAGKLFGVFERLHRADEYEGHGVGLAIVERIVRRHGGTVRAEGVPAKGATFFVTLPNEPATTTENHGGHAT